jgi:hypothetical protein
LHAKKDIEEVTGLQHCSGVLRKRWALDHPGDPQTLFSVASAAIAARVPPAINERLSCADFARSAANEKNPQYSRLDGFDWGVKPAHLPVLSRLELAAVSRVALHVRKRKFRVAAPGGVQIADPGFAQT